METGDQRQVAISTWSARGVYDFHASSSFKNFYELHRLDKFQTVLQNYLVWIYVYELL